MAFALKSKSHGKAQGNDVITQPSPSRSDEEARTQSVTTHGDDRLNT